MKDLTIDDVLGDLENPHKPRKNSRRKGIGWEKELCKIFQDRFHLPFNRSPGSGAIGTTANLDKRALDVLTADIITPEGFKWTIEAKKGYDIDLWSVFGDEKYKGRKTDLDLLTAFILQAEEQADRVGKKPLVIYRKDRCPPTAILKIRDNSCCPPVSLYWKRWVFVPLNFLLDLPDDFWVEEK